jgi:hypothetical protein
MSIFIIILLNVNRKKSVRKNYGPVCLGFFQLLAIKSCRRSPNAPAFQPASIRITLVKTVQNQHEHKIGWIVTIVGICCFLDPEPFGPLHLPSHVIHTILKFSTKSDSLYSQIIRKAGQKKLNQVYNKIINLWYQISFIRFFINYIFYNFH